VTLRAIEWFSLLSSSLNDVLDTILSLFLFNMNHIKTIHSSSLFLILSYDLFVLVSVRWKNVYTHNGANELKITTRDCINVYFESSTTMRVLINWHIRTIQPIMIVSKWQYLLIQLVIIIDFRESSHIWTIMDTTTEFYRRAWHRTRKSLVNEAFQSIINIKSFYSCLRLYFLFLCMCYRRTYLDK
jgi:hypothetical protein